MDWLDPLGKNATDCLFGDLLYGAVQSIYACGEEIEILEIFAYFGTTIQSILGLNGVSYGRLARPMVLWTCQHKYMALSIPVWKDLEFACAPHLYGCEI